MANTYTQIHIRAVFAVQNRASLIQKSWSEELYKYITSLIQVNGHKLLQINGMTDHIHAFFGLRPTESVSNLMMRVKGESSRWINTRGFCNFEFSWQEGYGAFSYAKSQVSQVIRYIQNQEEHHRKKTFLQEYEEFLQAFEVDYEDRYIFHEVI